MVFSSHFEGCGFPFGMVRLKPREHSCPNAKALMALPWLILLLAGCRGVGTQRFTAFAPCQAQVLVTSSRTVLDVRCANLTEWADYSFWENLQMLAPTPKRWKLEMTLQVERVVAGDFGGQTLHLHWLRHPTQEQSETLGIPHRGGFTNGMPLRIGFDDHSDKHFQHLNLMVRHD